MSLSKFPPHGNRKITAPTRRRTRPAARHFVLWEAIRRTRRELVQRQQRAEHIDSLFRLHIQPLEVQLTHEYGLLSNSLMDHYENNDLGAANHALLALWISDNLQSLSHHPFASIAQRDALCARWQTLNQHDAHEPRHAYSTASPSLNELLEEEELDEDDIQFDFGLHANRKSDRDAAKPCPDTPDLSRDEPSNDSLDSTSTDNPATQSKTQSNDHFSEPHGYETELKVSAVKKRLIIERLFRQLASVLHPDREQDEKLKADKHQLMSQCLLARKNKDINTLLTLYCEHVGEWADDISSHDRAELIETLEIQLQRLQQELRQPHFGDPLRSLIVDRYSTNDESQTIQLIDKHARSLDLEITRIQTVQQQLESPDTLLKSLNEQRERVRDRRYIDHITGYSPSEPIKTYRGYSKGVSR